MPNTCEGKNTFSDISKCGNLPLDNAFKNYMKGGNDNVVGNATELLKNMVQDVNVSDAAEVFDGVKNIVGGSRNKRRSGGKKRRSSKKKRRNSKKNRRSSKKNRRSSKKKRRSSKKKRRSQRGGRDSNGYYLAVGEKSIGGRPEVMPYSTCNMPVFPTQCRDLRGGSIRRGSRKSRRSLKKLGQRGGNDPYKLSGLPSNFSPNMNTRQFGCRHPYWTPKCV
jgi:hypothetical protein